MECAEVGEVIYAVLKSFLMAVQNQAEDEGREEHGKYEL